MTDRMREAARKGLSAIQWFVDEHGVPHIKDCPEDDTCRCAVPRMVNEAWDELRAALDAEPDNRQTTGGGVQHAGIDAAGNLHVHVDGRCYTNEETRELWQRAAEPEPSPTNEARARFLQEMEPIGSEPTDKDETRRQMIDSELGGLVSHLLSPAYYEALIDRVDSFIAAAIASAEAHGLGRAERECLEAGTRHWQNGRDDKAEACEECVDAIRALKEGS